MKKIGVIPAAGYGKRWGYYPKFLLPCGDKNWLLNHSIELFPCDEIVITVSDQTRHDICSHITRSSITKNFSILDNTHMELDFWGSMLAALEVEADYYYFTMPDTYCPKGIFEQMPETGFSLGVFQTDKSERFGMLRDGVVINKQMGEPGLAWGMLGWDKKVRDLWRVSALETYTDAINLALQEFSSTQIEMEYYYDMATWIDYIKFIEQRFLQ